MKTEHLFAPDVKLLAEHPLGIIAVEKPAGIKAHPNNPKGDPNCLIEEPYDFDEEGYLGEAGDLLFLINRLDSPTSGVCFLCSSKELTVALRKEFEERRVEKEYVAWVKGFSRRRVDTWRDRLGVKRAQGHLRTAVVPGPPNSETQVKLIRPGFGPPARSLMCLMPKTGRTHQLRVQCADRGMPILGDTTYGDYRWNRAHGGGKRLYLHCRSTSVDFSFQGKRLKFKAESPMPAAFDSVIQSF